MTDRPRLIGRRDSGAPFILARPSDVNSLLSDLKRGGIAASLVVDNGIWDDDEPVAIIDIPGEHFEKARKIVRRFSKS